MEHAAASRPSGAAMAPRQSARPVRAPGAAGVLRRRRAPLPPTAIDPAAAAQMTFQVQEFGLTLIGAGMVTGLACSAAAAVRGAAGAYTAAAAAQSATATVAAAAAARAATSAPVLVEQSLAAAASASLETTFQQPATVEISDIKSSLRAAAEAAVAAVKSTADAPSTRPAVAPRRADNEPNGIAVKPGMTVEEATKQVKDWIEAWRGASPAEVAPVETTPMELPGGGAVPTTRVTEPSMPPSAAAVLSAMTSDAPVANTPTGSAGEEATTKQGGPAGGVAERQPQPVLAAAGGVPAGADEASGMEKEAAYKVADSKLAQGGGQQAAKAERVASAMRKTLVEVGADYEKKIENLWSAYETKKAEEAELLAKSERILQNLAELEAAEKEQLAAAAAQQAAIVQAAPAPVPAPVPANAFEQLLARLVAVFQAVQRWVQQLVAALAGRGGDGGAAAGASA
ncbi:hypothetical protein C2E20_3874 [Micractinium conductrix]|uniref:Uncharacterized protein n=1 Tax=Micractinium conductrix TaxID=554055 RepID=A0A2P6VEU2_9CHLO|nr:hypothetical protein C2E20_3874 [Micractinium conductrix]|eukprot:PSC72613.1 hypothetical protein C2E20_3874 [Micractinium conductrix]